MTSTVATVLAWGAGQFAKGMYGLDGVLYTVCARTANYPTVNPVQLDEVAEEGITEKFMSGEDLLWNLGPE